MNWYKRVIKLSQSKQLFNNEMSLTQKVNHNILILITKYRDIVILHQEVENQISQVKQNILDAKQEYDSSKGAIRSILLGEIEQGFKNIDRLDHRCKIFQSQMENVITHIKEIINKFESIVDDKLYDVGISIINRSQSNKTAGILDKVTNRFKKNNNRPPISQEDIDKLTEEADNFYREYESMDEESHMDSLMQRLEDQNYQRPQQNRMTEEQMMQRLEELKR